MMLRKNATDLFLGPLYLIHRPPSRWSGLWLQKERKNPAAGHKLCARQTDVWGEDCPAVCGAFPFVTRSHLPYMTANTKVAA